MPGYPYAEKKGKMDVQVSADPWSDLETKILPRVRQEILFTVNPKEADIETMRRSYHTMPLVEPQVRFYRNRGYKIRIIDAPELFQIVAEKIV